MVTTSQPLVVGVLTVYCTVYPKPAHPQDDPSTSPFVIRHAFMVEDLDGNETPILLAGKPPVELVREQFVATGLTWSEAEIARASKAFLPPTAPA